MAIDANEAKQMLADALGMNILTDNEDGTTTCPGEDRPCWNLIGPIGTKKTDDAAANVALTMAAGAINAALVASIETAEAILKERFNSEVGHIAWTVVDERPALTFVRTVAHSVTGTVAQEIPS